VCERERERERERKKERERDGFFEIGSLSYLPRLGSNCDPDLCHLSN
jgi:hypothetical protein